jgi:hypothetical protein
VKGVYIIDVQEESAANAAGLKQAGRSGQVFSGESVKSAKGRLDTKKGFH